jgi:RNA polymerase sigma-70 factor (ECF subfamily)
VPRASSGDTAAHLAAGRAAWPHIEVAEAAFDEHLRGHARDGELPPLERAADLYLACACAHGVPEAARALDRLLADVVARAAARFDRSPDFADDVAQALREKLLLARPPKIAGYAGRASLSSWLTTAAVRTALNARRGKASAAHAPVRDSDVALARTPELDFLRKRHRREFEDAVRQALKLLSPRDRTLLRMNVGEGVSIDKLAALHGVGRSTAARWLAAARDRVDTETRARLRARLQLTHSEYESLAAALRSEIAVSIVRLLDTIR